jgi:hypothetical protein
MITTPLNSLLQKIRYRLYEGDAVLDKELVLKSLELMQTELNNLNVLTKEIAEKLNLSPGQKEHLESELVNDFLSK